MIWVPISRSSRGSSALTLACVPTGMNTGVATTPCAVERQPRRALVCESVLSSSNIARRFNQNGAIEHEILALGSRQLRMAPQIQQISGFKQKGPPPDQQHAAAQIKPDCEKSRDDSAGQERHQQQRRNRRWERPDF